MAMALSVDQRLDLITQGIPPEDIQGIDAIRSALEDPNKRPRCLWGESWEFDSLVSETHVCIAVTSPTGKRKSERALGDLL